MITLKLVQDGNKAWEKVYCVKDISYGNPEQVIVLTREELEDLHNLIDVQFMSENKEHENKTQEEIDNEMAWEDHKNKWSD